MAGERDASGAEAMTKRKRSPVRRAKCAECAKKERVIVAQTNALHKQGDKYCNDVNRLTAERDTAREDEASAQRSADEANKLVEILQNTNDALKAELAEANQANRKLQAFKDLVCGLADRDLAGNLHIKRKDLEMLQ